MATAQTIINVQNGKLSMTVLGKTIEFQLERAEEQCLSSTGVADIKPGLGVKKKVKQKKEPKPSSNKPPDDELDFEEYGGYLKLKKQLLLWMHGKRKQLSRHEQIAGHVGDGVLDVH
ncbi:hypothetical protein ACOSP7_006746 [Xanthoceras sorbifolium]